MKPSHADVQEMVTALFAVIDGIKRAQKGNLAANRLSLLYVIAAHEKARPSTLARELNLNQSSITRQIQALEEEGMLSVEADPTDQRACTVQLTAAGQANLRELNRIGLERFQKFVAGWEAAEVQTFTRLLNKFYQSKEDIARQERRTVRPHWRKKET